MLLILAVDQEQLMEAPTMELTVETEVHQHPKRLKHLRASLQDPLGQGS